MPKSVHLHQLIKSLSPSEKRYFRLFCQHNKSKALYQQLFDAIDQQNAYDEQALRKHFRGEKAIQHFHLTKRYLYDLILKSLRNYHSSISTKVAIQDQLRTVEILFRKGLFDQCLAILQTATKLASRSELPYLEWEIADWQRQLTQAKSPADLQAVRICVEAQRKSLQRLDRESRLRGLMLGLEQDIAEKPNEQWYLSNRTLYANWIYYQSFQGKQAQEQALEALLAELNLWKDQPHLIPENLHLWATTLNNLLALLVWSGRYEEAMPWITLSKTYFNQLKRIDPSLLRLILRTYNLELEIYRYNRNFPAAGESIQQIRAFMEREQPNIPPGYLLSFWYQFAYLYFLQANYTASLHWINQMLNHKFESTREDLKTYGHWLNLMVHLELKNYFVLRYYVDSTKRWLIKTRPLQVYEKALLRFFSKASHLGESDLPTAFAALHEQLFSETAPTAVTELKQEYLPIREWVASKLRR